MEKTQEGPIKGLVSHDEARQIIGRIGDFSSDLDKRKLLRYVRTQEIIEVVRYQGDHLFEWQTKLRLLLIGLALLIPIQLAIVLATWLVLK